MLLQKRRTIMKSNSYSKVPVFENGLAQPVEITTGLRTDAEVQVVRGLQVGDTIITSGTLQLRTGLPVKLDNID